MENTPIVIKNGLIINGKNEPAYPGTLIIENGIISRIDQGEPRPSRACPPNARVIDAHGAYVTPGFIDIHRHGDWMAVIGPDGGDDELLNRQGLTTVVNGNCGLSVAPCGKAYADEIRAFMSPVVGPKPSIPAAAGADDDMRSYLSALLGVKRTVNTGMLAGNGTVRASIAGFRPGRLTEEEVRRAQNALSQELSDGALAVSLGLGYAPEFEYDVPGLVDVLEPLRGTNIPITTHIRSEGDGSYESVEEVIAVAEALGIPLHLSHMKCIGRRNWHVGPRRTLELIHKKADAGMRIDFDLYPYKVGTTQLLHVIPPRFQSGGPESFLNGLRSRAFRDDLTKALKTPAHDFENIVELVGLDNIAASSLHSEMFSPYAGLSISEIAKDRHADPYETLFDILAAEHCDVAMLDTIACDDDMAAFYADPLSSVISDAIYPEGGRLHPRVYAAFPYFLIRFVRESALLPLEEAIHKMTANPAKVLGIDRGVIEEGAAADLCVFDLDRLEAPADFEDPCQFCSGFRAVLVNGQIVVENDRWNRDTAGTGQVIRRS